MEQCRELWKQHKDSFDSLAWPNWEDGTRIKYLRSGNKKLRLQEFNSQFLDSTWCEKGHVGFVIHGAIEINFQGRNVRFLEGSDLSIQAGEKHMARPITPTAQLFLVEDI